MVLSAELSAALLFVDVFCLLQIRIRIVIVLVQVYKEMCLMVITVLSRRK